MKKGIKILKGMVAAVLAATFIVSAMPINAKAVSVTYNETTMVNKNGKVKYQSTGRNIVHITPGVLARNVLTVTVDDSDYSLKKIKCSDNALKYKRTYKKYSDDDDKVIYRFSFYTAQPKLYKFTFKCAGRDYAIYIDASDPVSEITVGDVKLSTKNGEVGSYSGVTDITGGKLKVKMSDHYKLLSIMVGKYRYTYNGKTITDSVLYWERVKNKKKIKLSNAIQYKNNVDGSLSEQSMIATTIIRVSYRNKLTGAEEYTDYYLNRFSTGNN